MGFYVDSIGSINLHKNVEKKDFEAITGFFESHNVEREGVQIDYHDLSKIYINCEGEFGQSFFDELKTFIEKLGYDILPTTYIEVLGDDVSGWFYEDDKFIFRNEIEIAIRNASDNQLIDELERRWHEVLKTYDTYDSEEV